MDLLQKTLLAACIATTALSVQTAHAATSASVTVENFNLQYFDLSGGGNAPSLTWTSWNGQVASSATTFMPFDQQVDAQVAADFGTSLTTNTATLRAQSNSTRDPGFLEVNTASQPGGGGGPSDLNLAEASSGTGGTFEMTGYGLAIISLDWSVEVSGTLGDFNDYSLASLLFAGSYSDNFWSEGNADYNPSLYSFDSGDFTGSGSFVWTIFSDGLHMVSGDVTAAVYAISGSPSSEIPVPAAAWLFGSSLLSLIGVSRRRVAAT